MRTKKNLPLLVSLVLTLFGTVTVLAADDFWSSSGSKQAPQQKRTKNTDDDFWGLSSDDKPKEKINANGNFWGLQSTGKAPAKTSDQDFWAGKGGTSLDRLMQKREKERQAELRRLAEEKKRVEEAARIAREEEERQRKEERRIAREEEEQRRIAQKRRDRESEAESRRAQQFWKNADAEREREWNSFMKNVNDTNRSVYQEVDRINRENERKARDQERQVRETAEQRNRARTLARQQEDNRRAAEAARKAKIKEEQRVAEQKRLRKEEENREKEWSKQQREDRLAQEKAQRAKKVLPVTSVQAADGIVLTWQNSKGWWFACGPIQCIQVGDKTEVEALEYVHDNNRHNISSHYKPYGRCKEYVVHGVENYDYSAEKVRRLSKCN